MLISTALVGCGGEKYYEKTQTVFGSSIPFSAQIYHSNGKSIYDEMITVVESVGQSVNANSSTSALSIFNQTKVPIGCKWTSIFTRLPPMQRAFIA